MKLTKENKIIVGIGAVGVAVLGFLFYKKSQKEKVETPTNERIIETTPTPVVTIPKTGSSLNKNLILKVGSKGLEVRELQRLLGGIEIDGDFGKITLGALQKSKGVSQISINSFLAKPKAPIKSVPKTAFIKTPVKGAKLMCIKDGTKLYTSKQNADKSYSKGAEFFSGGILDFGDQAGKYLAAKSNGDFLIDYKGIYAFVSGLSVKAI